MNIAHHNHSFLTFSQVARFPGYEPPNDTHFELARDALTERGGDDLDSSAVELDGERDEMYSMKRARSARACSLVK